VNRRFAGALATAVLAVAAYGCGGSSGPSVSSDSGRHARVHVSAAADGIQTVQYQGVAFDVPADWPVYDLSQDPTMCVRFDIHAVYLGDPSPDMSCPAGRLGRTEAVLVQPTADATQLPDGASAQDVNGLSATVTSDSASTGDIQATLGGVRVAITIGDTDALAQQILASFRAAP